MDAIAGRMGQSRATLFRKLKAEGVTFETVLDDLRCRLALHYLSGKKVSVNETAYLVGFSDLAAFSCPSSGDPERAQAPSAPPKGEAAELGRSDPRTRNTGRA
jgi:AraC-like DNA-binding protein